MRNSAVVSVCERAWLKGGVCSFLSLIAAVAAGLYDYTFYAWLFCNLASFFAGASVQASIIERRFE